jgi:FlaA1/EpsC-like NDP-sugar epimerase
MLDGKRVLVTGGTGSLGTELVRRMLSGEQGQPEKVVVLSRDEAKQHDMRLSYLHRRVTTDEVIYENFKQVLEFRIGDVRDYASVCRSLRDADIVVNAAALKQVPTCEYFPEQAVLTNCVGAMNISQAIHEHGYPIEVVVGMSTDKACEPVSVMGMSKALQERIFIAANILSPGTRFVAVRYGNVLASRGSVIPLFQEQLRRGGPLTVTNPEMTRFLVSLDEAVDTVFEAMRNAQRGETLVPICPSARVLDIAHALVDGRDVPIVITGVRPGEKLHEVLISGEEIRHVRRRNNFHAISSVLPELAPEDDAPDAGLRKEYGSADCIVDREQLRALLDRHGLLVDPEDIAVGDRVLR